VFKAHSMDWLTRSKPTKPRAKFPLSLARRTSTFLESL
jgi:hypothetical protein